MNKLRDIIAYIIKNYPKHKMGDLSNARVTKLVYLADWHSCLRDKGQISPIHWYFDNYGPFVWDVLKEIKKSPDTFKISKTRNFYGGKKTLFSLRDNDIVPNLSVSEKKSIDHILEVTKEMDWDNFIKLVYSTFPIASSERYENLDLESLAKEYKPLREKLKA